MILIQKHFWIFYKRINYNESWIKWIYKTFNEYYKIQIRFTGIAASNLTNNQNQGINTWLNDNLEHFSEWSTVALIYGIKEPTAKITSLIENNTITWRKESLTVSGDIKFNGTKNLLPKKSYVQLTYGNEYTSTGNITWVTDSNGAVRATGTANANAYYRFMYYNDSV